MPLVKEPKKRPRIGVTVRTEKCAGACIRCLVCGYTGQADVVKMSSRRNGRRSLERCPECKSLNIVCEEKSIVEETKWTIDEWQGCYPSQWKGMIIPEAMAHPAKFSSRLIRRIYEHMFEEGWLKQGDRVLDPFGGVALGALHAMEMGLSWTGSELEPKFVELGGGYNCPGFSKAEWVRFYGRARRVNFTHELHWCPECLKKMDSFERPVMLDMFSSNGYHEIPSAPPHRFKGNIDLWNATFGNNPHWGTAVLLQGDSRKLLEVVAGGNQASVSSPPYVSGEHHPDQPGAYNKNGGVQNQSSDVAGYGMEPGQLGKMKGDGFQGAISSPPYEESDLNHHKNGLIYDGENYHRPYMDGRPDHNYGRTDGNLGAMPKGDFQGAVSSPPFRHSEGGTPEPKPGGVIDDRLYARHAAGNSAAEGYGASDGQLANMKEGDFQGSVSSPPYEASVNSGQSGIDWDKAGRSERKEQSESRQGVYGAAGHEMRYGFTDGQLGADSGDDFWMAARQIVEQVYQALEPGGHATWVVKDFVRDRERVPFSDQWRQLCEAVGFVTVHEHRATLNKKLGSQHTIEGDIITEEKKYVSFFRRIAEKNGSPKIDCEVVWCMQKPKENA